MSSNVVPHVAESCDLSIIFHAKYREKHDGACQGFCLKSTIPNSKKALKVEAVMEKHPISIERVHLHIQPNSLCKDRAEYISIVAVSVVTLNEAFRAQVS